MRNREEIEEKLKGLKQVRDDLIKAKRSVIDKGWSESTINIYRNELERNEVYTEALRWVLED